MSRHGRSSLWMLPENLFVLFAIPFGIIFTLLLPPLAGSDEYFHFQRIASVAYGHLLNEDSAVPSGVALFLKKTTDFLNEDTLLPYTANRYFDMAAMPLSADSTEVLHPNYLSIHSPGNYIPQSIAFRIGAMFNLGPLALLYIARLTALMSCVFLTFHAIRIIPSYKYTLCGLALLPPLSLFRCCLSSDAMIDSLGIFLFACIMREIARADYIKRASLIRIAILAFLIGACKFPYAAATIMIFAIPKRRFSSGKARLFWCSLTIIPGALAGLWWMDLSRRSLFVGIHYETWGGAAFPDQQLAGIIHDPIGFAWVLARTLSSFSFYLQVIMEMVGHYGTMAQAAPLYYVIMLVFLVAMIGMDGTAIKASYPLRAKLLTIPAVVGFSLITLTALYIHWTGLHAPEVKGFQGRYLYPMLPLFLLALPLRGRPHSATASTLTTSMFALMGLIATVPVLMAHWR